MTINLQSKTVLHIFLALLVLALWLLAAPASCLIGPVPVTWQEICAIFQGEIDPSQPQYAIIINIRLARGCFALLCGGALGVAGVALQGALRNPLADPFTLGISQGAACGASIAIAFSTFLPSASSQTALVSLCALAGALLGLVLALILGNCQGSFRRENVILAGIAVGAFMGALVSLVKALNEESVTSIVFWIMGTLAGKSWHDLPVMLATLLPGLAITVLCWRRLDILALGDEQAWQLGLSAGKARLWLLASASVMTAGCVAVCGIIGFVGLVIPHILRILLGPGHGPLVGLSFVCGGIFLLLADCLARTILDNGQELPVGVITSLVGGPFFAFLIWKK